MHRAKGQRFNEEELNYSNLSHMVSRKKIEECLDIVCHNTNVLEANNMLKLDVYKGAPKYGHIFAKYKIPALEHHNVWYDKFEKGYFAAMQMYEAWAAYAKGSAAEQYVCDSDNGPAALKKVLNSVEYAADDIDLAVALNKALDVVHFRSDLALAFIEDGKQTCGMVSSLPPDFVV